MATIARKSASSAPAAAPRAAPPQWLPGKSLTEARNLLGRLQGSDVFRFYLARRMQLVIPALVLFVVVSLACTAATVVFVAGTRPLILLLALLLAPFVFVGSLCVQGYVFVSWLEGRALARAYPHSPRHIPGALAAWLARELKAALGAPPPVPWIPALVLLVAPFGLLVFVSPRMALSLVALMSALPVLYARFDR
jgi:hypothetical protein